MNERQNSASDRQYEESNIWLNWSNTKEYMQSLINRSAIFARIRYKCSSSYRLKRQLLDSTLGLLTWYLLVVADLFPPDVFSVLSFTLISIKELIIWLSLYPAGLKLNSPLNNALSNFFLYHIYLWQIYLSVLSAWLGPTIVALSCVLGLSIFLATISDLISLLTIHMFCFHVYSTRLALLFYYAIASLWRVFRGRKYNPLRQRVDSVQLDSRQVFIATLFLTALIFLAPTVLVYLVVFSTLRFSVIGTKRALEILARIEDELITQIVAF
uniref:Phosphatidylinositol N-acetylglucosaminyltransferase subunit Q n=1 Tax=Ascaris suum TaxID=6253 RepID=F1LD25_ASCSU